MGKSGAPVGMILGTVAKPYQVQDYDSNDDRPATGSQPRRGTRINAGPEIE